MTDEMISVSKRLLIDIVGTYNEMNSAFLMDWEYDTLKSMFNSNIEDLKNCLHNV